MAYYDGTDTLYESAKDATEVWETGCGECDLCLNQEHTEDEDGEQAEDCTPCVQGDLCEYCSDELQAAERAEEREREEERKVTRESQLAFYDLVENMEGYDADEVLDLLRENAAHNGGLTHTVRMAYDPETKVIALADEEIEHIVTMLVVSSSRHNDTDYDDLLDRGCNRDTARMLIR